MTKVVHLQTHLPSSGNAAYRLHDALRKAGIDSSMLMLTSDITQDEHIVNLGKKAKAKALANDVLQSYLTRNAVRKYGLFSYPLLGTDVSKVDVVKNADVIYIHWAIAGFLSLDNIEQLAQLGKPIIVFMHDMWNITGGCHYSFDCDRFKTKCCSNCQILPRTGMLDLAMTEFNKKLKLYSKYDNLYFVSPSKWLYELACQSALTKDKPVYHIPNIINGSIFKPIDRLAARKLLDLSPSDRILAFGAASINSPYKGWKYLEEALHLLHQQRGSDHTTVLVFGNGFNRAAIDSIPFKSKALGRLRDDYSTALVYNASDVFVAPSLADNLPTTIMESLACGTPVVGFKTGGIPDMIRHLYNGYLADYESAEDLARGMAFCLDTPLQGKLLPDFDTDTLLQKHFDLYRQLLPAA